MKTIEYTNTGKAYADCDCEYVARESLQPSGDVSLATSSELFILAVRVLVKEGFVPHTEVRFLFKGQYIAPDKDGRLPEWPAGFCDHSDRLLCRMI